MSIKYGCCVDAACTAKTCMALPDGKTCGECAYIGHCKRLGITTDDSRSCDWFPRRFRSHNKHEAEHAGQ